MIYTTMTRGKVVRMIFARGWHATQRLMDALREHPAAAYFEVARCNGYLDGCVYIQSEMETPLEDIPIYIYKEIEFQIPVQESFYTICKTSRRHILDTICKINQEKRLQQLPATNAFLGHFQAV